MVKFPKDASKHPLINLFNNNCRYLEDILTVNRPNFLTFGIQIYPKELTLKLNKAKVTSTLYQIWKEAYSFFKVKLICMFMIKKVIFHSLLSIFLFGWGRSFGPMI